MHLPPRIQYHIFLICTLLYSTNCSFIFYTLQNNHEDMIYDINFIVLDKALDFKSYRKIFVELLVGYQKEFISKGTIPSIEDIHEKLIKIISINDSILEGLSYLNKDKYNLDFTRKFLLKIREKHGEFTFLKKIK